MMAVSLVGKQHDTETHPPSDVSLPDVNEPSDSTAGAAAAVFIALHYREIVERRSDVSVQYCFLIVSRAKVKGVKV